MVRVLREHPTGDSSEWNTLLLIKVSVTPYWLQAMTQIELLTL